ncbi:hypothetical protein [Parasphingorhabdus sp.]|uniref:hypothetical protein n=1 Tax=Parasphingorhabdus sp. TaxID=2709688 RepID=UPI003A901F5C
MKKLAKYILPLAIAALSSPSSAEKLNNADIIGLLNAGLGEETIVAKIESSDADYKTEVQDLIALKNGGVPGGVIAAMVTANSRQSEKPIALSATSLDPMEPHFAGVYLIDSSNVDGALEKIDSMMTSQTKTGGLLGYALTAGIASASLKAVIPGESAQVNTGASKPRFYFFFDNSNASDGSEQSGTFAAGSAISVQSPNEFSLIELKKKKGRREARFGSFNIGGAKTGIMDKDRIPFNYEQIRTGVYKVEMIADLDPGEYGFVYAISAGSGPGIMSSGTATGRIFGFTVE